MTALIAQLAPHLIGLPAGLSSAARPGRAQRTHLQRPWDTIVTAVYLPWPEFDVRRVRREGFLYILKGGASRRRRPHRCLRPAGPLRASPSGPATAARPAKVDPTRRP